MPFSGEQTLGALLAIGVINLWQARHWIRSGFAEMGKRKRMGAWLTPSKYTGALAGLALMVLLEMTLGMSLVMALIFVALFVLVSVAAARIRAEVGAPIHDFSNLGPDFALPALLPASVLSNRTLGAFTINHWFAETTRANMMAIGAENFRIGNRVNVRGRTVFGAMYSGAIFAIFVFICYYLFLAYRQGAEAGMHGYSATGMTRRTIQHLVNWSTTKDTVGIGSWLAIGFGAIFACLLQAARCISPAWPLNAAGFALSSQWAGTMLWGSFMVAWTIKSVILHAGGLRLYRKTVPFMMGVVAAQLVAGVAWACADMMLGRPIFGFCDH